MTKGQKSSATSGTRKKNARKAAQAAQETSSVPPPDPAPKQPKAKGKTKLSKREAREQRKKVYIPPTKPAPPVLDPLDTTGLIHLLPPELVVILRSLGKKDAVTRGKAMEELARWVEDATNEQASQHGDLYREEDGKTDIVVKMLPVWLHRAPVLFTHPTRRLRYLAASLQISILQLNPAREALLAWTSDIASQGELDMLLGTWAMLAHDTDRGVSTLGMRGWTDFISTTSSSATNDQDKHRTTECVRSQAKIDLSPHLFISLLNFAQRTVLDPQGLYVALNPTSVVPAVIASQHQVNKGTLQSKGSVPGKKGSTTPQSQPKKGGRYVPPSSGSSSLTASVLSGRVLDDVPEEEGDSDRAGRMRVGALGIMKWITDNWPAIHAISSAALPILTTHLSSPDYWSTLHPASTSSDSNSLQKHCPFSAVSFGQGQPQVRQSAWVLVGSLIRLFKGELPEPLIRILSTAILRSAWVETDVSVRAVLGDPLVLFLRDYAQAWIIDTISASRDYKDLEINAERTQGNSAKSDSESDADSGSASKSNDGNVEDDTLPQLARSGKLKSEAYAEFLQFLELACSGSPVEGYPLILLVLSGISQSILPTTLPTISQTSGGDDPQRQLAHPILQLLASFWSPLDAGLLDRRAAASSWLKALSECLMIIIRRGMSIDHTAVNTTNEDAENLLASQFSRLWTEILTKRLRVDDNEAAEVIARTTERLGKIGDGLFDASFDAFCSSISKSLLTSHRTVHIAPTFFHIFSSTFTPKTHAEQKARSVVEIYQRRVVESLENATGSVNQTSVPNTHDAFIALAKLVEVFGAQLFGDESLISRIDAIFIAHSVTLLQVSTEGVTTYLRHRYTSSNQPKNHLQTQAIWTELLGALASSPTEVSLPLLIALAGASLPEHVIGANVAMDELVECLVNNVTAAGSQGDEEEAIVRILGTPALFVSSSCLTRIASILSNHIVAFVEANVTFAGVSSPKRDEALDLAGVGSAVSLARKLASSGYEFTGNSGAELYTGIFLIAYIIPLQGEASLRCIEDAKGLWSSWISKEDDLQEMHDVVGGLIKDKLKGVVVNEEAEIRPEYIIGCITPSPPGIHIDPLMDILPSREEFDAMLDSDSLSSSSCSPSLALLYPTLPTSSRAFLASGSTYKKYTRIVYALLFHLTASRTVARSNLWALHHILVIAFYANENLRVEDGAALFGVSRECLEDIVEKVKSLATYLLGRVEDDLHAKIVNGFLAEGGMVALEDNSLASFVSTLVHRAKEKDRVRDAAVLGVVLQHLFADATRDDANLWLTLARTLEKSAPQTTITILASITAFAPEPSRLDRYRNELAASLIDIRAGAASTIGLVTLRLLVATVPDPDSDIVFLPQQRAVNVMKACQAWVAADEDDGDGVDEDVESVMTLVFFHLAPILQNVPGSHWDFIWDVIENNLENCSLEDDASLATLGRTLKLIIAIDDLASTNKPLRANWDERRSTVLGLVRDAVTVNVTMPYSEPRTLCRELALSVIRDLPSAMMDENTLPSMCHLLGEQSEHVQRMAYYLLHNAARKRTEHYVIEAAVDTEDMVKPELPPELLDILQKDLSSGEAFELEEQSVARNKEMSGYLLAWMVAFDLFIDASMKVRAGYFNQIRGLDTIARHFIPNIFDILGLFSGGKQLFKLDVWAVDEFYLETFDPASSLSLQVLAAHLYHRALLTVPASIRSWISDCTDKQLFTRVTDYTSSYFSPGIVRAELAQVRQRDPSSELSTTENLTIKVSSASGEVTASYMVDEQPLELSIRMPNDWPLRKLEVRDTKMVGVSGDKWRAWVLGVQQIVWQQNGRIIDGLTLFTKNVTLHFSGQVECAICYSIISVMDASLPQKPCKTCKNRFHASCLYKWFKTSHSSSCPLCRSDIL